jgi:hypothetical protein
MVPLTLRVRPIFRDVAVAQHALTAVLRVWQLPVEAALNALIGRRLCLTLLHITFSAATAVSSASFANEARTPWVHRASGRRWRSSPGAPFQTQSQLALASATPTDHHECAKSQNHAHSVCSVFKLQLCSCTQPQTRMAGFRCCMTVDVSSRIAPASHHDALFPVTRILPRKLEAIATAPHFGYAILLDWWGA